MVLGELAKLYIKPLAPSKLADKFGDKGIEVLFNPNTYSIVKPVTWNTQARSSSRATESKKLLNAPPLEFGGGGSRTFSLELFCDVTETDNPIKDVRVETNKIVKLTRIEREAGQPPVCEVSWGKDPPAGSDFPFKGVVTNLTQRFTLFRSTGEPLRANLTVAFREYLEPEDDLRENDPEFTTRVVRRGDTLPTIAAEVYGDPALWRTIAEANSIDDPRRLTMGMTLAIPDVE